MAKPTQDDIDRINEDPPHRNTTRADLKRFRAGDLRDIIKKHGIGKTGFKRDKLEEIIIESGIDVSGETSTKKEGVKKKIRKKKAPASKAPSPPKAPSNVKTTKEKILERQLANKDKQLKDCQDELEKKQENIRKLRKVEKEFKKQSKKGGKSKVKPPRKTKPEQREEGDFAPVSPGTDPREGFRPFINRNGRLVSIEEQLLERGLLTDLEIELMDRETADLSGDIPQTPEAGPTSPSFSPEEMVDVEIDSREDKVALIKRLVESLETDEPVIFATPSRPSSLDLSGTEDDVNRLNAEAIADVKRKLTDEERKVARELDKRFFGVPKEERGRFFFPDTPKRDDAEDARRDARKDKIRKRRIPQTVFPEDVEEKEEITNEDIIRLAREELDEKNRKKSPRDRNGDDPGVLDDIGVLPMNLDVSADPDFEELAGGRVSDRRGDAFDDLKLPSPQKSPSPLVIPSKSVPLFVPSFIPKAKKKKGKKDKKKKKKDVLGLKKSREVNREIDAKELAEKRKKAEALREEMLTQAETDRQQAISAAGFDEGFNFMENRDFIRILENKSKLSRPKLVAFAKKHFDADDLPFDKKDRSAKKVAEALIKSIRDGGFNPEEDYNNEERLEMLRELSGTVTRKKKVVRKVKRAKELTGTGERTEEEKQLLEARKIKIGRPSTPIMDASDDIRDDLRAPIDEEALTMAIREVTDELNVGKRIEGLIASGGIPTRTDIVDLTRTHGSFMSVDLELAGTAIWMRRVDFSLFSDDEKRQLMVMMWNSI